MVFAEHFSDGAWKRSRHLQVIDFEYQNLLADRNLDMLIVTMPVRHGKTEYFSKWANTHHTLKNPHKNTILCSNTSRLARSNSRWVRDKVHELAPAAGLKGVDATNASASEWSLDGKGMGGCISSGVTGSVMGFPADILAIDDYLKDAKAAYSEPVRDAQWDWFISTSSTRLEPGGKIIILATRWHSDDLIGRILAKRSELNMRVRYVNMQALRDSSDGSKDALRRQDGEALWPERWPAEVMERRKKQSGHWWHSIYQGSPKGSGMSEWPSEYFNNLWVDDEDWPSEFTFSACYLDPSKGKNARRGDYSAIVFVGYKEGKLYVDSSIERRPIPTMVRDFVLFNKERRPAFEGIEANAFQELLGEDYYQACDAYGYRVDPPMLLHNRANKVNLRIPRLGTWLAARSLRFRSTASNELLLNQLRDFPHATHDDGPDALEAAIRLLCNSVEGLRGMHEIEEVLIGD